MGQEDPKEQKTEGPKITEPAVKSLDDHVYEIWKSENPEAELVTKILRGETPASLHQEFRDVYQTLHEETDAKGRLEILRKFQEQGKLSDQFFKSLAGAIFREWSESIREGVMPPAEPKPEEEKPVGEIAADVKMPEEESPPRPLSRKEEEEKKRAKLIEFLQDADELVKNYQGDIPSKELKKIRGKLSSLGKDMRIYAGSRIGALLLQEAERADTPEEEQKASEERFLSRMEILLGENDAERLKASYELYKFILSHQGALGKIDPHLKSRFDERPFFNLSNQEQIWDSALLILDMDESLTPGEKRRVLSRVTIIEDFLEKVGHDELKDKIKNAKERRIEELGLGLQVQKVMGVRGELASELTPERTAAVMQEHQSEVKQKLNFALEGLVREGTPSLIDNPGYTKRIISDVLLLSHLEDFLAQELRGLPHGENLVEKSEMEAVKYSYVYFENVMRKAEKELEVPASSFTGEEAEKNRVKREVARKIKIEPNYLEKLRIALVAGFIGEEDYNQFLIFNEASAVVVELKAKNKEAEAADLVSSDKEGQLDIIRAKLKDANDLYELADYIRSGDLKKQEEKKMEISKVKL